jgi:glycosyltransferase involved in cell wall biosynthesis
MKVGLLTLKRFDQPGVGQGIPKYVSELYKNLVKLSTPKNALNVDKVVLNSVLWEAPSFYLSSFFTDLSKFDIIHNPVGFLRIRNPPANSKYVVYVHDVNPVAQPSLKWKVWHDFFVVPGLRHSIEYADMVMANSTQTRDELLSIGCSRSKIRIIALGVDKRFASVGKKRAASAKEFVVGYVGSFAINKNVEFIIDAAKRLDDRGIKVDLWGNKDQMYEKLASRASDLSNVRFRGFAPEGKLVSVYDSFSAFVFPSRYEGFGLPILEAQSRGLPVIIYKHAKIPEEVRRYCIEAKDPEHLALILRELKDNGYNNRQMAKARAYARRFTWEKTAAETLGAYESLV